MRKSRRSWIHNRANWMQAEEDFLRANRGARGGWMRRRRPPAGGGMSGQNLLPARPRFACWSQAEDRLMREYYAEAGQRIMYVVPGRSWAAIRARAFVLRLTSSRWSTWTGPMLSPRTAHLRDAA